MILQTLLINIFKVVHSNISKYWHRCSNCPWFRLNPHIDEYVKLRCFLWPGPAFGWSIVASPGLPAGDQHCQQFGHGQGSVNVCSVTPTDVYCRGHDPEPTLSEGAVPFERSSFSQLTIGLNWKAPELVISTHSFCTPKTIIWWVPPKFI